MIEGFFVKLAASEFGAWFKKNWKLIAIVAIAGFAWWKFESWKSDFAKANHDAGFGQAQAQYKVAVDAANARAANDEKQMGRMSDQIGILTAQRTQSLDIKLDGLSKGMQNEIASNPVYRDCRLTDGVLAQLQTGRAAVDASITASAPPRN